MLHNYKSQLHAYIGGKTAYKVLAKSYLGYCKNNTDDAYDTGDIVGADHPADTWSGSSLWASWPYVPIQQFKAHLPVAQ